jgi:hypothetical protein
MDMPPKPGFPSAPVPPAEALLSLDMPALRALAAALAPLIAGAREAEAAMEGLEVRVALRFGPPAGEGAAGRALRETAVRMRQAGMSQRQIAQALGRSGDAVAQLLHNARAAGADLPPPENRGGHGRRPAPPWTAEENGRCADLLRAGRTVAEIAEALGRPMSSVRTRVQGMRRALGLPDGRSVARKTAPRAKVASGSQPPPGGAPAGLSVTPRGVGHGPVTDGKSGQSAPPRPARPPGAGLPGRGSVASPQPSGRAGAAPAREVAVHEVRRSAETAPRPGESAAPRAGHPVTRLAMAGPQRAAFDHLAHLCHIGQGPGPADLALVDGLLTGAGLAAAAEAAGMARDAARVRWLALVPWTDPVLQGAARAEIARLLGAASEAAE